MRIIEVRLEGIPIPSENFLYHPKIGRGYGGKQYAFLYKDPIVAEYQEKLANELKKSIDLDNLIPNEYVKGIVCYAVFGIPIKSFWNRDLTNFVKATEDGIFSVLPYDDSQNIKFCSQKIPVSDEAEAFVHVGLKIITTEEEQLHYFSYISPYDILMSDLF